MMRILFFADTHLGYDYPIHPRIQRRRRGFDFFENYHQILQTAMDEKVDAIIHGGDLFFRSKIPAPIIEKAYEPLLPVLESGIQVFVVPGNHERSRLPASPLFHHPNFHNFDRPRLFRLERHGIKLALGGFPNIRNHVNPSFEEVLASIDFKTDPEYKNILCMHQSVEGAVVGVQNYRFPRGDDVIGRHQFPEHLDLILSGHIHRQQVLRSSHGTPIIYPGSIERTSFAERMEPKGYTCIELPDDGTSWEFRPLKARPMREIKLPENLQDHGGLIEFIRKSGTAEDSQSILRIRCSNEKQIALLKVAELRAILPETMNVDLIPLTNPNYSNRKPAGSE